MGTDVATDKTVAIERGRSQDVVPRWEWRVFAERAPRWSGRPAAGAPPEKTSTETYILSNFSPNNVKIRDAHLDIKQLESVSDDGLELWNPVLKAAFPISSSDIARAFIAWRLLPPRVAHGGCEVEEFVHGIVPRVRSLRAITIEKKRWRVTVAGCAGELAVLHVNGQRLESLSFEDVEPDRIRAALLELHLEAAANCNYPMKLKQFAGMPAFSVSPRRTYAQHRW